MKIKNIKNFIIANDMANKNIVKYVLDNNEQLLELDIDNNMFYDYDNENIKEYELVDLDNNEYILFLYI